MLSRKGSLYNIAPNPPFPPDRSLSTFLVHDQDPPCPPLEKPRVELTLLSHHDGDRGHPPRDTEVANISAEVEAKKQAWIERLYEGAAGSDRPNRKSSSSDDPAGADTAHQAVAETPDASTVPLERWKPRYTAKQIADAKAAKAKFAEQAQVYEQARVGAKSADFAPDFSYFNVLYTHPNFGAKPWGSTGVKSDTMKLLPPIQSREGLLVPASARRAQRVNWGNGKRAFPLPGLPAEKVPVSPSKHCCVSRPLPRTKKKEVNASTNPWLRVPPHTSHSKMLYEAMYGPSPNDKKRNKKQQDLAATKLQATYRGHASRK